jgi:hypothetical protein
MLRSRLRTQLLWVWRTRSPVTSKVHLNTRRNTRASFLQTQGKNIKHKLYSLRCKMTITYHALGQTNVAIPTISEENPTPMIRVVSHRNISNPTVAQYLHTARQPASFDPIHGTDSENCNSIEQVFFFLRRIGNPTSIVSNNIWTSTKTNEAHTSRYCSSVKYHS